MHRMAGVAIHPQGHTATPDLTVVGTLKFAGWAFLVPCRVVAVCDEPHTYSFTYGTLPSHPEEGEELFALIRKPDGGVWFEITAFSRPAPKPWWVPHWGHAPAQAIITERYTRALVHTSMSTQ